jgi:VacB/RNase II family 3'-5' exoribonuclease
VADPVNAGFAGGIRAIENELGVAEAFPPEVQAAAAEAAASPKLPALDRTDLPFVTIDPPGSKDLDQALHIERTGDGYRVFYAIADVAAFVEPGGPVDVEAHQRGQTLYAPDHRVPLHPPVLSEDAASLLAGQVRPALLWTIDLDARSEAVKVDVVRALVKSRSQLEYAGVQASVDAGNAPESLALLKEVGELRLAREQERGGISLPLPEQEVVVGEHGWSLTYREKLPVEDWNAQISLLAGMEAAKIMCDARTGILRVVPPPAPWQIHRLRRSARGLDITWPHAAKWPDVVRGLDRTDPDCAAFLTQAAHLLRGAGYAKLDASNGATVPTHSGVAAPYAHVTAPLRRLADRYANEIVLAHCAGRTPPEWAVAALDELVTTMQAATHREHAVDRAVVDAVECAVLAPHVGEQFDGFVVDRNKQGVVVQLRQPAIVASMPAQIALGKPVQVTLVSVDPLARRVELAPVPASE